jgi:myo-inositol 2-dehydrogenase/D-chiro-inositol 1-dehydrogenase
MIKKVNVGIIGVGRIGRIHCKHLSLNISEANVLMICDIKNEEARKCAKVFNVPAAAKDYREIIENPDIDAVIICSSTDTHSLLIEQSAMAGKHIFCEKPIDINLKKIDRALRAVEKSGVKLQVGFNRRYDPDFRKAWEFIKSGKIGKVSVLKITSRDPEPPSVDYLKKSGGIFLDMTIHDFDMARFLSGSEVDEIYASGSVLVNPVFKEIGDLDTVVIILKFKDGSMGIIDNSRKTVFGYDQRIEIFGSKGMISVTNKLSDTVEFTDSKNAVKALPLHFFMDRYIDSYINEMKDFIGCVVDDREPSVTGIDGKIPVILGKAAKLSYDTNKPVKITEV